jgi:aminoglycoside 6'-N-acetyltransferase
MAELGAHRVVAQLEPGNAASAALCTRLGMRQEAHHRSDIWVKGAWEDTAIFAILDHEWRI